MELLKRVKSLQDSGVSKLVDSRIREFKAMRNRRDEVFKELCFCIMTANCGAEPCIRVQQEIGDGFLTLGPKELEKRLKECGYRFHRPRGGYMAEARQCRESLSQAMEKSRDGRELREWLVENIKGLGYKEASHFLRNIGYDDVAIIDFHIVDLLVRHGLIEKPKTMTKKRYAEIEKVLAQLAEKSGLTLAELDLYLWYMETGKVLK